MMTRMPERLDRQKLSIAEIDHFAIPHDVNAVLRKRIDARPQLLHAVAIDAGSARPQLGRVDEVGRTNLVNGHRRLGVASGECAGGSGMVEVDVRDDDPIEPLDVVCSKGLEDLVDRRLRSRLNQRSLFPPQQECAGYPGMTVHMSIDDRCWVQVGFS